MVGKEVIRSRAAPIGISVTVSTGSEDFAGLGCKTFKSPFLSSVQPGMRRAFALSSSGAVSGVNGWAGSGPAPRTSSNEPAGVAASSTRP